MKPITVPKNTPAFNAQAMISFGLAIFAMLVGIYYLDIDPWIRAFLALSTVFLVTSSFTLAKCIRDTAEYNELTRRTETPELAGIRDPFTD